MAKKFFDILPPQKRSEEKEEKIEIEKEIKIPKKKKPSFFVFFLLFFLIAFLFLNFKFTHCEIKIYPKVEEKKIESNWKLEKGIKDIDEGQKKLPFEIFEKEIELGGEIIATKEVEKKAEGKIKLYNQYATWPETWAKGTKFMSSVGKIFVSKDKISVPPAKVDEKGKILPSFVEVEVEALEPGEDYNIEPAKFSVLAFKGTEKYTKYWGESTEKMKGGGRVKIVQKEDIERAKINLEQKAIEKVIEEFKKEKKEFYFIENFGKVEKLEIPEKELEGKEGKSVSFEVKAKIKVVGLPKEKIDDFFKKKIKNEFSKNYNILVNSENLKFPSFQFNFEKMEGNISMIFGFKATKRLDLDEIKKNVILLNIEEAKEFLEKSPDIEKVEIRIFPGWFKKIPKNCNITLLE